MAEGIRQRVYVETTIPSFYYEVRTEPEMIARPDWTRTWWDSRRHAYLLVTSVAVIDELQAGAFPNKDQALALLAIRRVNALLDLFTPALVTPLELLA